MDLLKIMQMFIGILLWEKLLTFVSATITLNNIIGSPYIKTKILIPLDPNRAYNERYNYARKFGSYGDKLINSGGRFPNLSPNNVPRLMNSRRSNTHPQFFPHYTYYR